MTTWMTLAKLEQHLRTVYPPTGLGLRCLVHARTKDREQLNPLLERAAQSVELLPGLGCLDSWFGVDEDVPFAFSINRFARAGIPQFGLHAWLPVLLRDSTRIDVSLLQVLARVVPGIRNCQMPYVDSLPFPGTGWGVIASGDTEPLFRSPIRDDANNVAKFFYAACPSDYTVATVNTHEPAWVVTGPDAGPYVSRIEVFYTRERADRHAANWSTKYKQLFTVQAIQLDSANAGRGSTEKPNRQ